MIETLSKGGLLMLPIALCSVLSLAILFERLWRLRRTSVLPARLDEQAAGEGEWDEARLDGLAEACRDGASPLARILGTTLRHRGRRRGEIKELVEEV